MSVVMSVVVPSYDVIVTAKGGRFFASNAGCSYGPYVTRRSRRRAMPSYVRRSRFPNALFFSSATWHAPPLGPRTHDVWRIGWTTRSKYVVCSGSRTHAAPNNTSGSSVRMRMRQTSSESEQIDFGNHHVDRRAAP